MLFCIPTRNSIHFLHLRQFYPIWQRWNHSNFDSRNRRSLLLELVEWCCSYQDLPPCCREWEFLGVIFEWTKDSTDKRIVLDEHDGSCFEGCTVLWWNDLLLWWFTLWVLISQFSILVRMIASRDWRIDDAVLLIFVVAMYITVTGELFFLTRCKIEIRN